MGCSVVRKAELGRQYEEQEQRLRVRREKRIHTSRI